MIIFIVWGEGEGVCGDVVANSANIMQRDYTLCNIVVAFCYLLLLFDNFL